MLLVIGKFGVTIHILHLLPENGTIERFSLTTPSSSTTFSHGGATEQAREQIGAVTFYVGDGETADSILDDVQTRIRKLRNDSLRSSPHTGSAKVTQLVQDVLQPAVGRCDSRKRGARSLYTSDADVPYFCRLYHTLEGKHDPDRADEFSLLSSHQFLRSYGVIK